MGHRLTRPTPKISPAAAGQVLPKERVGPKIYEAARGSLPLAPTTRHRSKGFARGSVGFGDAPGQSNPQPP